MDKIRLLTDVVRLIRSFWDDTHNGTSAEKFMMRQLVVTTTRCHIITLKLPDCDMKGQDVVKRRAGVLVQ